MKNRLQRILGTISWLFGIMFWLTMIVNPTWWKFIIGFILFIFGLATSKDRRIENANAK